MAILKHTTKIIVSSFMAASLVAHASECESIPPAISILNWIGELPKQAELQIYKGDSKFIDKEKSAIEKNDIRLYQLKPENPPTLRVNFTELKSTRLPINADFILILDDKIEYRFREIEPPKIRLGCSTYGKVNACEFGGNIPNLMAKFNCGKKVIQK